MTRLLEAKQLGSIGLNLCVEYKFSFSDPTLGFLIRPRDVDLLELIDHRVLASLRRLITDWFLLRAFQSFKTLVSVAFLNEGLHQKVQFPPIDQRTLTLGISVSSEKSVFRVLAPAVCTSLTRCTNKQ
jgi:hypothetical protein